MNTGRTIRSSEAYKRKTGRVHKNVIAVGADDICISRRQHSLTQAQNEDVIKILILGRPESGKTAILSAIAQCSDFMQCKGPTTGITTTATVMERVEDSMENVVIKEERQFEIFFKEFRKITPVNLKPLVLDGQYWAVVWVTDLLHVCDDVDKEVNEIKVFLEESLRNLHIRGVLVFGSKREVVWKLHGDWATQKINSFTNKVRKWGSEIQRPVVIAYPFACNPANLESQIYYNEVCRCIRHFFLTDGIDVLPWGKLIKFKESRLFPRRAVFFLNCLDKSIAEAANTAFVNKKTQPSSRPDSFTHMQRASSEKRFYLGRLRGFSPNFKIELVRQYFSHMIGDFLVARSVWTVSQKELINQLSCESFMAEGEDPDYTVCVPVIIIDNLSSNALAKYDLIFERLRTVLQANDPLLVLLTKKAVITDGFSPELLQIKKMIKWGDHVVHVHNCPEMSNTELIDAAYLLLTNYFCMLADGIGMKKPFEELTLEPDDENEHYSFTISYD